MVQEEVKRRGKADHGSEESFRSRWWCKEATTVRCVKQAESDCHTEKRKQRLGNDADGRLNTIETCRPSKEQSRKHGSLFPESDQHIGYSEHGDLGNLSKEKGFPRSQLVVNNRIWN